MNQAALPLVFDEPQHALPPDFDPFSYDHYIVGFSGGKDCTAALLHLLEMGIPKDRIELWHHDVDDPMRDESDPDALLMDWPVTRSYVKRFADAFGLPLYFSWRKGGFEGEMLREDSLTQPAMFQTPDGVQQSGGIRGTLSTRRKFPQQAASLATRWCSSSLKIDICATAITNQPRFNGKRTLLVTGERAEESSARAKYSIVEPHKTSNGKRTVDQWRVVHGWAEKEVWAIIERHKVNPHPAYQVGWSRCSCMTCIFLGPDHLASVNQIAPQKIIRIAKYEQEFGSTLRRDGDIMKAVGRGKAISMDPALVKVAMSKTYDLPIFVDIWKLPQGAFGECAGPT